MKEEKYTLRKGKDGDIEDEDNTNTTEDDLQDQIARMDDICWVSTQAARSFGGRPETSNDVSHLSMY